MTDTREKRKLLEFCMAMSKISKLREREKDYESGETFLPHQIQRDYCI